MHNKVGLPLKRIDKEAFKGCTELMYVTGLDSLVTIGESAFENCRKLRWDIEMPMLEYIYDNAFNGCQQIEYFSFPYFMKKLGENAFQGCGLKDVVSYAPFPPEVEDAGFKSTTVLRVMSPAVEEYKSASSWGQMKVVPDGSIELYPDYSRSVGTLSRNYGCKNTSYIMGDSWVWADCSFFKKYSSGVPFIAGNFTFIDIYQNLRTPWSISTVMGSRHMDTHHILDMDEVLVIPAEISVGPDDINKEVYSAVTDFEEFNVPVRDIARYAYMGESRLKKVIIEAPNIGIATCAFAQCVNLSEVTVHSLNYNGNAPHAMLKYPVLESRAFAQCNNLTRFEIQGGVFNGNGEADAFSQSTYDNCWLVVPDDKVRYYKKLMPWSQFKHIAGINAVSDVAVDGTGMPSTCDVYSLDGRMVRAAVEFGSWRNGLQRGLYIVKGNNGYTAKFAVE